MMPRCPFATFKPISGSSGSHTGGPFKIVHHTTEGSTAKGAFAAFKAHKSDPHFTVDATTIFQHIDTNQAARALRNAKGGVQTNRDSAVQIEVVGFAHRPKTRATLENVRRLCRWIEATHSVPRVWPNGFPKPATASGKDPGGHNRNAATWDSKAGHYGHSNVPENTHWDPAYTKTEVEFLMMDDNESLESPDQFSSIILEDPGLASDVSRMPDHADPEGLELESVVLSEGRTAPRKKRPARKAAAKRKAAPKAKKAKRKVAAKRKPAAAKRAAKRKPARSAARKAKSSKKRSRRKG
jgi:hypothetical protein